MWELDCEEGWAPKNWWFWTVVLEKNLESPLDSKEIQPVHSEVDQPWDFFGRNEAKAETLVLWPPHAKSWLIGKDSDVGRDWGQEEKGTTEDEMAGWHHWLDGCESKWTQGVGDGQGGLACCDSWGHKESDMTERLIWSDISQVSYVHDNNLPDFILLPQRHIYFLHTLLYSSHLSLPPLPHTPSPLPCLSMHGSRDISSWVHAAAAKSLQSCLTLCDPIDYSPPGSSVHGISQARILEWAAISFSISGLFI